MSDLPDFDLYATLEVSPEASTDAIGAAWKRLLKRHHPDFGRADPGQRRAKRINVAHDWLSDPGRRARYDTARGIRARSPPPGSASPAARSDGSPAAPPASVPIPRARSMPYDVPAPPRRLPIVVAVLIVVLAVLLFLAPSIFAPGEGTTSPSRRPAASPTVRPTAPVTLNDVPGAPAV